jgi:hypothetical protein
VGGQHQASAGLKAGQRTGPPFYRRLSGPPGPVSRYTHKFNFDLGP